MSQEQTQEQEQVQVTPCVLCGTKKGAYKFYRGFKDENLCLCVDCLSSATRSLADEQLADMSVAQLKRHMEVRDELASRYKSSFTATKTFSIGKKRSVPIIEVDEPNGLWAVPSAHMPLAQSVRSIVDVDVTLTSEELSEDDQEMAEEIAEGLKIKDLVPFMRWLLKKLYKSKHTDLAPIPEGHFVNYLELVLTLDDKESGISKVSIDLLPFWFSWPSHVNAAYDCAHELIEFLKQLAAADYKQRKELGKSLDLSCSHRLSSLLDDGRITDEDAEILRYYIERMPKGLATTEDGGSSLGLVKSVVDTVVNCLSFGEKAPDLLTRHTTGVETFLGAFYRYAPGLSASDVVYIVDKTKLHSGKGGMLFAQNSFAVDDFSPSLETSEGPSQPIPYDDLLYVGRGKGKGRLVLAFKDGSQMEVNGGTYAHFIFAVVNCIAFLRDR